MLIVSGTFSFPPEDVARLLPAANAMAEATRQEDGCIEYEFSERIDEPGKIRLFERWESALHLAAHFETDHMATWRAALGDVTVLGRSIDKYEGTFEITPL